MRCICLAFRILPEISHQQRASKKSIRHSHHATQYSYVSHRERSLRRSHFASCRTSQPSHSKSNVENCQVASGSDEVRISQMSTYQPGQTRLIRQSRPITKKRDKEYTKWEEKCQQAADLMIPSVSPSIQLKLTVGEFSDGDVLEEQINATKITVSTDNRTLLCLCMSLPPQYQYLSKPRQLRKSTADSPRSQPSVSTDWPSVNPSHPTTQSPA